MLKQKIFNYVTLLLASLTILIAISSKNNNTVLICCSVMISVTLIFNIVSNKCNEDFKKLTKEDEEFLKNAKFIKNDKDESIEILRNKVKKYKKRKKV